MSFSEKEFNEVRFIKCTQPFLIRDESKTKEENKVGTCIEQMFSIQLKKINIIFENMTSQFVGMPLPSVL